MSYNAPPPPKCPHSSLLAVSLYLPQHYLKKQALPERTSGSDMGGVEAGSSLLSSPGAGLLEDPVQISGKGGLHSSSRTSHANSLNTSSVISSYLFSTLTQLPAHFSTNGKSNNRNVMKCNGQVGFFFFIFAMYFRGCQLLFHCCFCICLELKYLYMNLDLYPKWALPKTE